MMITSMMETDDYDAQILNAFGKELRNDIIPMVESKYSTYAKSITPEGLRNQGTIV